MHVRILHAHLWIYYLLYQGLFGIVRVRLRMSENDREYPEISASVQESPGFVNTVSSQELRSSTHNHILRGNFRHHLISIDEVRRNI